MDDFQKSMLVSEKIHYESNTYCKALCISHLGRGKNKIKEMYKDKFWEELNR